MLGGGQSFFNDIEIYLMRLVKFDHHGSEKKYERKLE
jgi:hypothetical protein